MKIRFTEYLYPEDWDVSRFARIIHEAGFAHEVDVEELIDKVWDGGTRELALNLEIDTETGIILVVT